MMLEENKKEFCDFLKPYVGLHKRKNANSTRNYKVHKGIGKALENEKWR